MGGACSKQSAVEAAVRRSLPSVGAADVDPTALPSTSGLAGAEAVEGDSATRDVQRRQNALNRCFDALDKDGSGSLDLKEIKQYLFRTGVALTNLPDDAHGLLAKLDVNKDGQVSRDEFVLMMELLTLQRTDDGLDSWVAEIIYTANSKNVTGFGNVLGETVAKLDLANEHMEVIHQCYQALGPGPSGYIEAEDLKRVLGARHEGSHHKDSHTSSEADSEVIEAEVQAILNRLDVNCDGKVSEQEFFVTFSNFKKALKTEARFQRLLDSVVSACQDGHTAEVLKGMAIKP